MWIGTRQGLLYSGAAVDDRQLPPVVLTGAAVFDAVRKHRLNPHLIERLELPDDARAMTLEFVRPEFDRSREVRYRYRLDGLETAWTDDGGRRFARYTTLPPGDYLFRVQASSDGIFRVESEMAIGVTVQAPFHVTPWFRVGILLLVVGVLFVGYRLHIRRLKRAERMRLKILRGLHDELDESLAAIALTSGTVHDRQYLQEADREQLADLHSAGQRVREELRDIEWYVDPEQDTLASVAARMRSAADAMLMGVEHEFHLSGTTELVPVRMSLRRQVFRIYMELLRNVVHHARARRVVIDLRASNGVLRLQVSDDGSGFDPGVESAGGLEEIRHRAARAGADLTIQSDSADGTRVRLEVPLSA